jgi:hypothetical protein
MTRVKIRKPDINSDDASLREDALPYVQLCPMRKSWTLQPEVIPMIKGIWVAPAEGPRVDLSPKIASETGEHHGRKIAALIPGSHLCVEMFCAPTSA